MEAAREQMIAQALTARTEAEIAQATEALARWIEAHPEDTSLEDVYEVLELRRG